MKFKQLEQMNQIVLVVFKSDIALIVVFTTFSTSLSVLYLIMRVVELSDQM